MRWKDRPVPALTPEILHSMITRFLLQATARVLTWSTDKRYVWSKSILRTTSSIYLRIFQVVITYVTRYEIR